MHFACVHVYFFSSGSKVIKGVKWSILPKKAKLTKGQISNIIEFQFYQCHRVVHGQTYKSVHGDLFIGPTVEGSEVNKGQICNITKSEF